ncbi:MAG: hypothetical protein ACFFCW_45425 [Candidatus Hodarchaeota archaeon]
MRDKSLGSPIPLGALLPIVTLLLSLTYVFFTILLFIADRIGKIYLSIRTHPRSMSWLLGLYVGTYIISCSLLLFGLEATIKFDGIFIVIYLASVLSNLISLWQIMNRAFSKSPHDEVLKYIEEVKIFTKSWVESQ